MDEGLKNKAYLEGSRLKNAGYDDEVIFARLEKQGIPEELRKKVIANLQIQRHIDVVKEQKPLYNIALLKIAVGFVLAIASAVLVPGVVILPIGLVVSGVVYALLSRKKG